MQVILDASAVLAYLLREPGGEGVAAAIDLGAGLGTANLAEVMTRLVRDGVSVDTAREVLDALPVTLFDLDAVLALRAGEMILATRKVGLSLGDRLCLALAIREKVPALTADTAWAEIAPLIGATVRLIR
jgi:PIN domain nuclease of toxin-antitoxin system